jgi:hypothetical protein
VRCIHTCVEDCERINEVAEGKHDHSYFNGYNWHSFEKG